MQKKKIPAKGGNKEQKRIKKAKNKEKLMKLMIEKNFVIDWVNEEYKNVLTIEKKRMQKNEEKKR